MQAPLPSETALADTMEHLSLLTSSKLTFSAAPTPYHPVTRQLSCCIAGISTHFLVQILNDRLVVAISQKEGRIGSWLLAERKQVADILGAGGAPVVDYEVTRLLGGQQVSSSSRGSRGELASVLARQILEQTTAASSFNTRHSILVLGLTLQPCKEWKQERALMYTLVKVVKELVLEN